MPSRIRKGPGRPVGRPKAGPSFSLDAGDGARGEHVEDVDVEVEPLADERQQVQAGLQVEALQVGQAQLPVVAGIVDVGAGLMPSRAR